MSDFTVGHGSHLAQFHHPKVGTLNLRTGIDEISWGYGLNVARWPTYGGEVIQILSCYIDDLSVLGSLQTYGDMERTYTYFFQYMQIASQGDPAVGDDRGDTKFNQIPMTFTYPHRGWEFTIIPKSAPSMRKARDVVIPNWRIDCHVVDEAGDMDNLKDMILQEAEIKTATGSKDDSFDGNFSLTGEVGYVDENPFSDPFAAAKGFDRSKYWDQIGDFYSKIIPSYLHGDFDSITGGIGSVPAFGSQGKDSQTPHSASTDAAKKQVDKSIQSQKKNR
jgi:hypothetical protein